jgi:hypothetical protein
MEIITWFQNNWENITKVFAYVIAIASIIVRFTPTIKDNEMLEKIIKFLGKYVAFNRTVDDDAIRASKPK